MRRFLAGWVALLGLMSFLIIPPSHAQPIPTQRPTVILFLADGMGVNHTQAASYYLSGQPEALTFQAFPYQTTINTNTAEGEVTDSAASATAMATGQKVSRGVISRRIPGDEAALPTVLEMRRADGWRTGLVTTSFLTDASPAAFAAHAANRIDYTQIATDYLYHTRPDLLLGGGGNGLTTAQTTAAGYISFDQRDGMWAAVSYSPGARLAGLFGEGHMPQHPDELSAKNWPRLAEMTSAALSHLSYGDQPFFLFVEQQATDAQSHANNLQGVVWGVIDLNDAVEVALRWAEGRDDVLILVVSDHECGELDLLGAGQAGQLPAVRWGSMSHSARPVRLYAWGATGWLLNRRVVENSDVFGVLDFDPAVLTEHAFLPLAIRP
ncbi:MAG: alkaline phosphatase [Anaerolineales bacterium]|nr:alkaline phosphatase [Anaerolineales bacterium]